MTALLMLNRMLPGLHERQSQQVRLDRPSSPAVNSDLGEGCHPSKAGSIWGLENRSGQLVRQNLPDASRPPVEADAAFNHTRDSVGAWCDARLRPAIRC